MSLALNCKRKRKQHVGQKGRNSDRSERESEQAVDKEEATAMQSSKEDEKEQAEINGLRH
jgi:hypothetical protein